MPSSTIGDACVVALRVLLCGAGLFGLNASAQAQAADSVTLPAIGLVQRQIIAHPDDAGAFTFCSAPFSQPPVYVGFVSSVENAKSFSCTSANWKENLFAVVPHLVRIRSGSNVGRCFLIKSNTEQQIKIKPRVFSDQTSYSLTDILNPGDIFEVLPANTLSSLFGITNCVLHQGNSVDEADNVGVWQRSSADASGFDGTYLTYYNNGEHWLQQGSDTVQDDTVIYPGEGFTINRLAAAGELTLSFRGLVPAATGRIDVTGPGLTVITNPFPFDSTLAALGLSSMPQWQSGSSASNADAAYLWNGKNLIDFEYDGVNWRKKGKKISDDQPVPAATGFFVLRHAHVLGPESTFVTETPGAED